VVLGEQNILNIDEEFKRRLWSKLVAFDLNLRKNPAFTVAARFARENTNDLGDRLNIAVSTMIVMEFKKYMFLVAIELKKQLSSSAPQPDDSTSLFLRAPFPPPPNAILKFWDLLILYSEHYAAFCQALYEGVLDSGGSTRKFWLDKPTNATGE
jgi:hypothetical protein